MKVLGLRIGEPKPEYLDATKPIDHIQQLPDAPKRKSRSVEGGLSRQESDGSLPSGASSQESADSSTPIVARTVEELRDVIGGTGSSASDLELKSRILELAISDIGMGKYQWYLFVLCGMGWAADNLWLQGVALILPTSSVVYGVSDQHVRYATLVLNVGLSLGAFGWGFGSDKIGRRLGFNSTLVIAGIFAFLTGIAPNFIAEAAFLGVLGLGVGGSLPVDGTMFLEFLPHKDRIYLTLLSVWWPIGQVVASLFAWLFLGSSFEAKRGLRLFLYTMGAITLTMAISRWLFDSIESPKFLLASNRQAEAVRSVRALAHKNGTKTWLTEEILNEIGGTAEVINVVNSSIKVRVRQAIASFGPETKRQISPLFGNAELGINTALLWIIWLCIGIGYPLFNSFLPQYLKGGNKTESESNTYRNYLIISTAAVPGSLLACYIVNVAGRKRPMAFATMIAGVCFFLFTLRNDSSFQLGFGCAASFFQNIMFGILYAYTPETFPGSSRGTGCGIAHSLNRLGGIIAPLIAANVGASNPSIPIYVSGSLIIVAFLAMCCLRIETQNRQSL
ncbi:putative sugar transporter protein [Botrytis fragariae]|uniref:Putative sugar transporter protein n=1 Tax=Botrytis fragariae TaxID=1964551 RepID=A0A8H6AWK5_9HELO|nr:putative sugar transporter protein [Botrytis fragariae]KAF5875051.1 putative sugar transporter protein [Botrytis fragariae]